MKSIYQIACSLVLITLTSSGFALDLRKDLSTAQFDAAGLNKLSEAELDTLQALMDGQKSSSGKSAVQTATPSVASAKAPENSDSWKPEVAQAKPEAFNAELDDSFSGRSGRGTSISLSNGQVWQQTDAIAVSFKVKDKRVRVRPAMFGWRLMFLQNNQSVAVKRIR
jgi:hypothetical protein